MSYKVGEVTFTRECFATFPDKVIVWRLRADQSGKVNFTARVESPQKSVKTARAGADQLALTGEVEAGGLRFEARLRAHGWFLFREVILDLERDCLWKRRKRPKEQVQKP